MQRINIVGAGLAGLSAALTLAEAGKGCRLISPMPSERAQSVMAEGGFNAALDTMGEQDSPQEHFEDTMRGGVYLADPNAVAALCENAPKMLEKLCSLGAALRMSENGPVLRNFGGQKKKRTAYAKSSTGKILMTALIDAVRKYEAEGLVERYAHHRMTELLVEDHICKGLAVKDIRTGEETVFSGAVILASGGMNSLFPGLTTGTVLNTGDVSAEAFFKGAELANLEFIQYHPTTVKIPGKRCLISEAARGEGGRLYVERQGEKWYFMEEKYPEYGNLSPRDVVSREMQKVMDDKDCGNAVFLDMTELDEDVWKNRLTDLRKECMELLGKDPAAEPIEVSPGIHYFMGGICVDELHRTNCRYLYAAGECACQYHGANRLGGNSMLGAVYGGRRAALTVLEEYRDDEENSGLPSQKKPVSVPSPYVWNSAVSDEASEILRNALGIFRTEESLMKADEGLQKLLKHETDTMHQKRLLLGRAILLSALNRSESRGAHTRLDYPEKNDAAFRKTTVAVFDGNDIHISLREIPKKRGENA